MYYLVISGVLVRAISPNRTLQYLASLIVKEDPGGFTIIKNRYLKTLGEIYYRINHEEIPYYFEVLENLKTPFSHSEYKKLSLEIQQAKKTMKMKLIIGVTGTRNGMNSKQKQIIENLIEDFLFLTEYEERVLHHGQCVGVDVQCAKLLKNKFGFTIHSHPPIKTDLLGLSENDLEERPKSYFARNRDIVDSSSVLFVVPKENSPQNYGGTWYTYNYAKKNKKHIIVIYPNGTTEQYE